MLFAAQFVVIISGMFVNTKTGLASMALILMFTTICLIQLANDKQTNWKPGQNIMTYMCTVWLVYYFFEILNPNNVMEAWNIGLTPYALIPLICAFIVPIVIRTKKDIELLLIVWSIFVLIFTIKGYWQKNHGFSEKDLHFLYALGGWRTHLICRIEMETRLFFLHRYLRALWDGNIRNKNSNGSHHGRFVDGNYHR